MCIKTVGLPVLTLSDFVTGNSGFILLPLQEVTKQYEWIRNAHKQSFYTILFCKEGAGQLTVDQQLISLKENSVICLGPGSVNSYDFKTIRSGWMLAFSESFFSMRYNDNVLYNFDCLKYNKFCQQDLCKEEQEEWQFYLRLMNREYKSTNKDARGILRSYMNIILSILNRSNDKKGIRKNIKSEKDKKVTAFEQLVEKHFSTKRLPSFYALEMHISVNYLNRICKEKRGISSGDIIRNRIVIEAERLLLHTFLNISEISYQLGFESVSYFVTFFKKNTGYSPYNYRKHNKQ